MAIDIALTGAETLYSFWLNHPNLFTEMQMQFVPVERMPDWVPIEHQSDKCIGLRETGCEKGVCMVLEEDIETTLNKLISRSGKLIVYQVSSIRNMTGICFCDFSAKRFLKLYSHLLSISKNLGIPVPTTLFVDSKEYPDPDARGDTVRIDDMEIPIAPIVLALILGPMLESNLRRSLLMSQGSWTIFFTRPLSVFFLLLAVVSVCWPLISRKKKAKA